MKRQRLIDLREKKGLTQSQAAKEIGIAQSTLAMTELGQRNPRDNIKVQIAKFYNVTVGEIFFDELGHDTRSKTA